LALLKFIRRLGWALPARVPRAWPRASQLLLSPPRPRRRRGPRGGGDADAPCRARLRVAFKFTVPPGRNVDHDLPVLRRRGLALRD
jgi:hypothetical protein